MKRNIAMARTSTPWGIATPIAIFNLVGRLPVPALEALGELEDIGFGVEVAVVEEIPAPAVAA